MLNPTKQRLFLFLLFLFLSFPIITFAEVGAAIQTDTSVKATSAEQNVGFKQSDATEAAKNAALPGATAADKQAAVDDNAKLDDAKAGLDTARQDAVVPPDSCTLFSNLGTCVLDVVGFFIFNLANGLLGLCGLILNFVVVKTIFQFSTLIGNSPGLLIAWGILRDIGNMLLLFGFVFIGLSTILQIGNYSFKKALPRLLIFAVLINFSLFAAEAVIDASNIFGSIMYTQASNDGCTSLTGGGSTQSIEDCINYGIAGHIMKSTGLTSVYASNYQNQGAAKVTTFIGLAIFAIVGAVVFLAAAIMLTIRAVTLTFVMVTAPIGFAGMALPPFKKFADKWWKTLISQAFFAPILILLMLISLKITDSFSQGGSLGDALATNNTSTVGVLFVFTIVIAFLIASLVAAKNFGAYGAASAIKNSKMLVGLAPGFVGRNTIGAGAAWGQKKYENSGAARKLRTVPVFGKVLGGTIDDGITAGLNKTKSAKYGGPISYADKQKKDLERVKALKTAEQTAEEAERKAMLQKDLTKALAITIPEGLTAEEAVAEENKKSDAVAAVLQKMSTKEIEELEVLKKSGANLEVLAKNLSPETFAALVKDGNANVSETKKSELKEARFGEIKKGVEKITEAGGDVAAKDRAVGDLKKSLKSFSSKDLQNLPPELFENKDVLANLSDTQREDLIKSGNLNPAIVRNLKALDPVEKFKAAYDPSRPLESARLLAALKTNQVAKLPADILTNGGISGKLTINMLNAINKEGSLTQEERNKIANVLRVRAYDRGDAQLKKFLETNGSVWNVIT